MSFSNINEPVALTGNVIHEDSNIQTKPYFILCLPISIDDCSYIYRNLSKKVNYTQDPIAPLYLGHLSIAAIIGEALLIILTSQDNLDKPSFIHFNNISFISADDSNCSIKINSEQNDQTYEFTCENVVDYMKWFYTLNQALKITNGEIGRKLRFSNILFNNENNYYNKNKYPSLRNLDDSFSYNYLCSEKYIENYNKEKEKEIRDSKNSKLIQNKQNENSMLLIDTQNKEDQMKSSQSLLPFNKIKSSQILSSDIENEKPLGYIINQNQKIDEILFETSILPQDQQKLDILSNENIKNVTASTAKQKINVMNQPIINNNINVINSGNISHLKPLLNSATQNTFNPDHYSNLQTIDPSKALNNTNSKMNNISMNYGDDMIGSSTKPALPHQNTVLPFELPRQQVFYNPTSVSNPTVFNDINKANNIVNSSESSIHHTLPRLSAFYNPVPTPSPSSNSLEVSKPTSSNSLPSQPVSNINPVDSNELTNLNSPHTLPRYPASSIEKSMSTSSAARFNRQYEEHNKSLSRTSKKAEQPKKKFQSLPRYNSYKVTITRFKSIFSKNKENENQNIEHDKQNSQNITQ